MGLRFILLVIGFTLFFSNMSSAQQLSSKATFFTIRLKPRQDLKKELMAFAAKEKIKAGCIVTCVGSLEQTNLRFANQPEGKSLKGHFEILSLVGTFSDTSAHLHLSIADSTGATIGGHLLDGNLIYTTAEIVIGELTDLEFDREVDSTYGYQELTAKRRKK
jgi:uncharacterized protein